MEIGKKLKDARASSNLTQESVADKLNVSRQTISNWETEKSYPDIINVIELSDLYSISLDDLLKGDVKMIEHLKESTNVVKSNKQLIVAIAINIFLVVILGIIGILLPENIYYIVMVFSILVVSTAFLMYQIIKRL